PKNLNSRLLELLLRCLAKNPKSRWHAAADVRVEIEAIISDPTGLLVDVTRTATASKPFWKRAAPAVLSFVIGGLLIGSTAWFLKPVTPGTVSRFAILLPEGQSLTATDNRVVTVSPDGTQLVYVVNNQLYLRSLADLEARPIPGTNTGAIIRDPVFSPDGHWLAFWTAADSTVKRIAISGGAPVTLCSADFPLGISWDAE